MYLPLTCLAVGLVAALYYCFTRKYNYWKKKNVPFVKPIPLLGNFADYMLFRANLGITEQRICRQLPDAPLVGAYFGTEPALIVQDPDLIKLVTNKDFYYFSGREISDHLHKEEYNQNLFATYGDSWKVLRQNFSPIFSSSKLKIMYTLIENCSETFEKLLEKEISISKTQEARDLIARYTMDCIGTCAFGIDTRAMGDDTTNPFTRMGRQFFDPSYVQVVSIILRGMWPSIFYKLGFKLFPDVVTDFFNKLMSEVFHERRCKKVSRNDLVNMVLNFEQNKYILGDSLCNLKTGDKEKVKVDVDDRMLTVQCFAFFTAGYETSATTASFTLYELAKHPEAQERARREVREWLARRGGRLAYECVSELPFLEQCVDEALRLYPVLGVITREVVEPYRFPGGPLLERGTRVHIPVYHLHRHPTYFPDPEVYRPERLAAENRTMIHPYTYFAFGEGPRICIGMRFAKMQVFSGLITILKNYRVELAEGMSANIELEPKSVVTSSKHGIQLNFIPL